MTIPLYMDDSYLKEFEAKVVSINGKEVILDKTAFYPTSGGIEHDTGKIVFNEDEYNVVDVIKRKGEIIHILDREPSFKEGDVVKGIIDWERRYKLMRLHTATHVLAAILYKEYNALITGGHITPEYAREDYNLNRDNWKEIFEECVNKANELFKKDIEVKIYYLDREEAFKIPGIVKLANKLPPSVKKLRIVEIPDIDIQADGGPHVKNLKEIKGIKILKLENRGKNNKRIYYTLI